MRDTSELSMNDYFTILSCCHVQKADKQDKKTTHETSHFIHLTRVECGLTLATL